MSVGAMAQTYDTLPTGSKPYGNFYLGPDGNLVFGNAGLKFRVLGTKKRVDSLLALKQDVSAMAAYATKTGTETLTNKTLTAPVINTPDITNGTANSLTLVNGTINATPIGASIPSTGNFSTVNATASSTLQLRSEKGQNNGYASLDGSGKVPVSQMPDALVGAVVYQGNYNASTNTPTLPVATGNKGKYYVISTAGTQEGLTFENGDWIISNGTIWQKVDNSTKVASVNGMTGAVTIDDVPKWNGSSFENGSVSSDIDYILGRKTGTNTMGLYSFGTIKTALNIGDGSNLNNVAANSDLWKGYQHDMNSVVNSNPALIDYMLTVQSDKVSKSTTSTIKTKLGLDNGSYLNNAVAAATEATYWGGRPADLNAVNNSFDYIIVRNGDGTVRLSTKSGFKSELATSLQNVLSVDNNTTISPNFNSGLSVGNGSKSFSQYINSDGSFRLYNNTVAQDQLILNENGNVGIGSAPASGIKFHTRVGTDQNFGISSASGETYISAFNDAVSANVPLNYGASVHKFYTGNVTIGGSDDGVNKLQVNGSGKFAGDLTSKRLLIPAVSAPASTSPTITTVFGVNIRVQNGGDNIATTGFATGGKGEDVRIRGGNGGASVTSSGTKLGGNGGSVELVAGDSGITTGTTGVPGDATLQAGSMNSGATISGPSGHVYIKGGTNVLTNGLGGSVWIVPGFGNNNTGSGKNLTYDGNTFLGVNRGGTLRGAVIIGSGDSDLTNDFQVTGNSKFNGNINVTGTSSFSDNITVTGSHSVTANSLIATSGGTSSVQLNNSGQGVFTSTATKTITVDPDLQRIQAVNGQIMNLNFETPTATRNVLIRDRTGSLAFTDEISTTASGTYTPTLSNTYNVASTTALTAHYMRVGDQVTVTGRFGAASTSVGTMQVGISLPIASSMTAADDATGMGSSTTTSTFRRVDLYYKVASSTVVLETVTNDTGDNNYRFQFTYTIK